MLVLSAESVTLTERKQKGLRLFAHGETNWKIAGQLCMAEITVRFHLRNIYNKIDVGTRLKLSVGRCNMAGGITYRKG